jgi:hypothetical protein
VEVEGEVVGEVSEETEAAGEETETARRAWSRWPGTRRRRCCT